jgi:hypothetical protein
MHRVNSAILKTGQTNKELEPRITGAETPQKARLQAKNWGKDGRESS